MGFAPMNRLVVEDSPAGIRVARAGGMRVVAYLGGSHARSTKYHTQIAELGPDRIITDVRALLQPA
jgi:beta-phosphoglucomutase-like phosphatase (HAD superfamily)